MATNRDYLESARQHLANDNGGTMAEMMLGTDVPTVQDLPKPFMRYIRWEQVTVYALMQRKRALLETIVEHLEGMDPDEETNHPKGCGDDQCAIVTKEGIAGEIAMQALAGQLENNIIEVPEGMTAADIVGSAAGDRLADEVEAYVREHGEGGYL